MGCNDHDEERFRQLERKAKMIFSLETKNLQTSKKFSLRGRKNLDFM
jgi:hypothetical protein